MEARRIAMMGTPVLLTVVPMGPANTTLAKPFAGVEADATDASCWGGKACPDSCVAVDSFAKNEVFHVE